MEMMGAPSDGAAKAGAWTAPADGTPLLLPDNAIPASAPPAAAARISHFAFPDRLEIVRVSPVPAAMLTTSTAAPSAPPRDALIWIRVSPTASFQAMPATDAIQSDPVSALSDNKPLENRPPAPSLGKEHVTVAPPAGLPESSVTRTSIGQEDTPPALTVIPWPRLTRTVNPGPAYAGLPQIAETNMYMSVFILHAIRPNGLAAALLDARIRSAQL